MAAKSLASCLFCKIVKGDLPTFKLLETGSVLAFLDINPLSKGHTLVIPKYHAEKIHELPDQYMSDILPIAKKIAIAQGFENYNILQNNGHIAHQEIPHVHFHVINKPTASGEEGLIVGWPAKSADKGELGKLVEEISARLANLPESSL